MDISIVIPLLNESESLPELYRWINEVMENNGFVYEIVFIDDGSTDNSWKIINDLKHKNSNVKGIKFRRNYGKSAALSEGFKRTKGNVVFTMDADLQHPPELIHKLIRLWENGSKVVVCKRIDNKDNSFFRKLCSKIFYKVSNLISSVKINPNSTDFRLLDKLVISYFKRFNETPMMYKRIVDWIGFKESIIEFSAPKRLKGKSSFTYVSLINLAVNALSTYSTLPLKIISISGLTLTFVSFLIFIWMLFYNFYISNLMFSTLAFFVILNTFLMGIVLIALGLVGIYIGNIYSQVLNRPLYIVEEKINFDKN